MSIKICVIFLVFAAIGCAKVSVETKKPIKLDINMRVDIYQHVVDDVESVNDQIYGTKENDFNAIFIFSDAYAADLSQEAADAILRRKERTGQMEEYFSKGYIGEDRNAFLRIRENIPLDMKNGLEESVEEENRDRDIIYRAIAKKNNTDILEVKKIFFEDDYQRAASGGWFEVYKDGKYIWVEK